MIDFSALEGHQDMLSAGTPDIARLRADAVKMLSQLDWRENLQTQKVIPLPAGMWNALYLLEPAGVVAKLSTGDNGFEINFLRQAAELNVPVPQVYANGSLDHPTIPKVTYFLMSYIQNSANAWGLAHEDDGMSVESLKLLGAELGQNLATLHERHLGYVERLGTRVEKWQWTLTDGFSPNWDEIAPNALFDAELLPLLRTALDKTKYFEFTDGCFIHGDLVLTNVLLDKDSHRLKAIIDPAGCAGMPMFDLAYAAMPYDHGFEFYEAMRESYQRHSTKFDAPLFYTSMLVVAYRHERFHTPEVRESIFRDILPHLEF
jgi:aminoglycoside phosphotransferase (APT) family kinase protein